MGFFINYKPSSELGVSPWLWTIWQSLRSDEAWDLKGDFAAQATGWHRKKMSHDRCVAPTRCWLYYTGSTHGGAPGPKYPEDSVLVICQAGFPACTTGCTLFCWQRSRQDLLLLVVYETHQFLLPMVDRLVRFAWVLLPNILDSRIHTIGLYLIDNNCSPMYWIFFG